MFIPCLIPPFLFLTQLPEAMTSAWAAAAPSPQLHLPPPNPYIPTDFSLRVPPAAAGATADGACHLVCHPLLLPAHCCHFMSTTFACSVQSRAPPPARMVAWHITFYAGPTQQPALCNHAVPTGAPAAPHTPAQAQCAALASSLGLPLVLATPPALVLDVPGLRVWHKGDNAFGTPRANAFFRLSSPNWCGSGCALVLHCLL